MTIFKNKTKNAKKRNGETFVSVSKHPKKNLKVVEQKLRSVFSLKSRMAAVDKIRFCSQPYARNLF